MRAREIIIPTTHPHVVTIDIDPGEWRRIERVIEERPELRLLHLDDGRANQWRVVIGCASEAVRDAAEDGWG